MLTLARPIGCTLSVKPLPRDGSYGCEKVKHGSPEAGDAQVVMVVTLHDGKMDAELLPIGNQSPHSFASRQDMDRVQALDRLAGPQRPPARAILRAAG